MTKSKRIEYIDTLRGFAIFLVTFGHLLENGGYSNGTLFQLIYSFHMPLFICISGYVLSYSFERKLESIIQYNTINIKEVIGFIYGKFKRIMLPYYVWSLIAIPLFMYTYNGNLNYTNILKSVFITNTSFWFLPCLFGLSVLYILYKYIQYKLPQTIRFSIISRILICMFLICSVTIIYIFTKYDFIRSIISYILPFILGVIMAEYKRINNLVCNNSAIYTTCLLTFCLIVGLFINQTTTPIIEKIVRLLCGIISIPICFNFFKNTKIPANLKSRLDYIGQNTLIIYILQSCFLHGLIIIEDLNILLQLVYFSILTVILITIILLVSKIFKQNHFLRVFFLGEK